MTTDLPLRCRCGRVQGVLIGASRKTGNRTVCYCDDCQAFAHFLGRPDILDAHGGTDIFQVAPAQLRITSGEDSLRCMRLSPKGLYRWYADCCRTPIGNTLPRVPFVGVSHVFMADATEGRSRDEVLGKPRGSVWRQFAVGDPAAKRELPGLSVGMLVHVVRLMLTWWLTGKGSPSAFFADKTRAPRVEPRVLGLAERQALRQP